ncbi:aminoglycoside 6'-N-acetyltransferase [Clostridium fungisolvens]|uniref:Aminoglycoside N(6')-acetyltransferase type 1 n=1 Tax=Clostridium fungisolvens TaxID=1604897 RepID=A0A6V8SLQ2_9CLOT|nr:aminoglycoside 6'-N-acetyltransferase [Clostridium fungisolvens]GFP75803.1 Aminoglycoside N(6')-acetyltransferase type 1 [Clostridium fungisolvens]
MEFSKSLQEYSFERVNQETINSLVDLELELWPDNERESLLRDTFVLLDNSDNNIFLVCRKSNQNVGFIHVSLRHDYVEGADFSPTGFIEGIYVEESFRGIGIARKLVECGEVWCREKGCRQLASDIELNNKGSFDFHNSIGFEETNRIICFLKNI